MSAPDGFGSERLEALKFNTEVLIEQFKTQDPASIDVAGRIDLLPRAAIKVLRKMKRELNEDSRTAVEQWEQADAQRRLAWQRNERANPYGRALVAWQEHQNSRGSAALNWEEWHRQSPLYQELQAWQEYQRDRDRELWADFQEAEEAAFRIALPPNWRSPEINFPDIGTLEELQLREGLPLAWVPPNRVLAELLTRRTAASRRRVIARESKAILDSCRRELRRLRSEQTAEWRRSAGAAAAAIEDGHWAAGQALAAIALDTATIKFVRSSYKDAVLQSRTVSGGVKTRTPPGTSEHGLPTWSDVDYPRAMLVLHSLYGAFGEYNGRAGENVPEQFSRHGTIHSVSHRQYNKANALIALMHLVALLCLVEDK